MAKKTNKKTVNTRKYWAENYFLILSILLLLIIVFSLTFGDVNIFEKEQWDNPPIFCSSRSDMSITKLFPAEIDFETGLINDPIQMTAYCKQMQSTFSDSKMEIGEAEDLYLIIHNENIIRDTYKNENTPDLTVEELKQRVAVKKIDKDTYEIFYVYYECGYNYEYQKIEVENDLIKKIDRLESWKAGEQC